MYLIIAHKAKAIDNRQKLHAFLSEKKSVRLYFKKILSAMTNSLSQRLIIPLPCVGLNYCLVVAKTCAWPAKSFMR